MKVYAFDDPNHEQPGCSEIEGIKDIAMDALAEIASMTIDEIVKKAEEDRAFLQKEEMMRDSNQSQMAAVDDYLHKVNEQLSKRKKMGPCAELAMMVDAGNSNPIQAVISFSRSCVAAFGFVLVLTIDCSSRYLSYGVVLQKIIRRYASSGQSTQK